MSPFNFELVFWFPLQTCNSLHSSPWRPHQDNTAQPFISFFPSRASGSHFPLPHSLSATPSRSVSLLPTAFLVAALTFQSPSRQVGTNLGTCAKRFSRYRTAGGTQADCEPSSLAAESKAERAKQIRSGVAQRILPGLLKKTTTTINQ